MTIERTCSCGNFFSSSMGRLNAIEAISKSDIFAVSSDFDSGADVETFAPLSSGASRDSFFVPSPPLPTRSKKPFESLRGFKFRLTGSGGGTGAGAGAGVCGTVADRNGTGTGGTTELGVSPACVDSAGISAKRLASSFESKAGRADGFDSALDFFDVVDFIFVATLAGVGAGALAGSFGSAVCGTNAKPIAIPLFSAILSSSTLNSSFDTSTSAFSTGASLHFFS
mmetsp:Transcript_22690/g.36044  ORF Transcript_22690/g.36044 Transcript_22690/m.36044 type:complete len:226 (-) Transcript_22690:643-1320(-)|eukprot:CAMPEP_0169337186 /NCGR_PEP_ID=MMETSP1017-20121227/17280_1 /TAXON_ID=342587 /ORGANISM="Karlodinium micrum, Strain CCMP2283" /LENGTH=225 /DNA_ID=CAMNT_0009432701 /DNA_START=138 /DNA_END=815 /DNA_ORIENTATION=+